MTEFWQNLTARERAVVAVAGVLTVLVVGYFMLVRPLADYEAESQRALARAKAVYQQIDAGAAEVEAARGTTQEKAGETTSLRVAVAQSAREIGVAISRLQPGADGALTVWVESVPSPVFYRWLETLSAAHGIAPVKVVAQKSSAGVQLRVQLEFGGA